MYVGEYSYIVVGPRSVRQIYYATAVLDILQKGEPNALLCFDLDGSATADESTGHNDLMKI